MPGELLEDPSVRLQTPRLCAPGRRSPCLQSAARQPRQRPKPWAGAKRSLPRPPGAVCKSEHQEVAGTSRPSSATASSSSAAPGRRRRSLRAVAPPGRSPCSLQPAAGGAAAPPGPPPAPRTPRAPAPSYPAGPPRRGPSSDPRPPWSAAAAPRLTHGAGESRAGPGQGGVGSARRGGEYARMPSACGDGPGSAIVGAGGSAGVSVPRPQGRGGRTAGPSGAAPRAGCCPRAGGEACLHAERARGRDPRGTPGLHSPVSPPGPGPVREPRASALLGARAELEVRALRGRRCAPSRRARRLPACGAAAPSPLRPRGSESYFKNSGVAFPSPWGKGVSVSSHFPALSRPLRCLRDAEHLLCSI